jgi:PTH1 family peptidyl-tRNA hydrolase
MMDSTPLAWLIVGVGNPGPVYAQTRHNVGYWLTNRLARRWGIQMRARRLCAVGEGAVNSCPVVLAKPRTYVNQSGHAVAALMKHHRLDTARLLVICDDLDLPTGMIRLRPTGGHGGHNGLRSIIGVLGTTAFPRLRIGIGRPLLDGQPVTDPDLVSVYVLSNPTPTEQEALEEAVACAMETVETLVQAGLEAAMNRHNR